MSEKTGAENQVRKPLKTRCYYTDYVNHAIRFYLSTPERLDMTGKRKADMDNWIAVQSVLHFMKPEDKQVLTEVYKASHRVTEGVRMYCERTGTDEHKVWVLITKTSAAIAKRRGLT